MALICAWCCCRFEELCSSGCCISISGSLFGSYRGLPPPENDIPSLCFSWWWEGFWFLHAWDLPQVLYVNLGFTWSRQQCRLAHVTPNTGLYVAVRASLSPGSVGGYPGESRA